MGLLFVVRNADSTKADILTKVVGRAATIAATVLAQASMAGAVDRKVFSTLGVHGAVEQLSP